MIQTTKKQDEASVNLVTDAKGVHKAVKGMTEMVVPNMETLIKNSLESKVTKVTVYKTSKYKVVNMFYKAFKIKGIRKAKAFTPTAPLETGHTVFKTHQADH